MSNSILLAPGPVQLHPEVKRILSQEMIHHRTPEFDQILSTTFIQLKKIFQTNQPVFALTCTGSGGMECLLVNVINPNDKVLAIISGKFGERWASMAEEFGAVVIKYNVAWGNSAEPEQVKKILLQHPDIQVVLCQACETSTGTSHPIKQIAEIIKLTNALFLVDAITALGAYDIPMDEWNIDGLVGGSQKAFMLPTGMSFVSFSEKSWVKIKQNKNKKFYFNIENEYKANLKGETLFSSNVIIIKALHFVLNEILHLGLDNHFKTIYLRAEYTRLIVKKLNLQLYSSSPSNSVTAFYLPKNLDGVLFRDQLESKYQLTVMGGQDQLKGQIIRFGHMGYISKEDLHQSSMRLAQLLIEFNYPIDLKELENYSHQILKEYF